MRRWWSCGPGCGVCPADAEEHRHPSLSAPPDAELQPRRDAIFCQALVAAVCTFSEQLLAALSYRYNNNGEYEESSRDASRKWLEQVAATGVLLHCQSLLSPATAVSEWPRPTGHLPSPQAEGAPAEAPLASSSVWQPFAERPVLLLVNLGLLETKSRGAPGWKDRVSRPGLGPRGT